MLTCASSAFSSFNAFCSDMLAVILFSLSISPAFSMNSIAATVDVSADGPHGSEARASKYRITSMTLEGQHSPDVSASHLSNAIQYL